MVSRADVRSERMASHSCGMLISAKREYGTKTYADLLVDLGAFVLDALCHAGSQLREST